MGIIQGHVWWMITKSKRTNVWSLMWFVLNIFIKFFFDWNERKILPYFDVARFVCWTSRCCLRSSTRNWLLDLCWTSCFVFRTSCSTNITRLIHPADRSLHVLTWDFNYDRLRRLHPDTNTQTQHRHSHGQICPILYLCKAKRKVTVKIQLFMIVMVTNGLMKRKSVEFW